MGEYTTLQEVKDSFMGPWDQENWDTWVEKNIPVAEAMIEQLFEDYGRSLEEDLESKRTKLVLLKTVLNQMIVRRLNASNFGGQTMPDYSSMSQAMGPFSVSVTPVGSNSSFYVRKDERRLLGLPRIVVGGFDFHLPRDPVPYVSDK